jgi:hypothetical protein
MILSPTEFGRLFETFQKNAFRLETLSQYIVPEERAALDAFLTGTPLPPSQQIDVKWRALMKRNIESGKMMQRVHIIPSQLTPYLRYEIEWAYSYTSAIGEDIRLIVSDYPDSIIGDHKDFWLFDDKTLVIVRYETDGTFVHGERIEEEEIIERHRNLKQKLLNRAEPLSAYLSRLRST